MADVIINLRSSHIKSASYNEGDLQITFKNGGTYVYHNVPNSAFVDLLSSRSPGSFLNREIKRLYKFTKKK